MKRTKYFHQQVKPEKKWTAFQLNKLNWVQEVLAELDMYKPLTLRQVYYQLVGKGYIENTISQYTMLCTLISRARLDGLIPWGAIEDRSRQFHDLSGWRDADEFIKASVEQFLTGYRRDLLQTQDIYPELWVEKDAVSTIFIRIAERYTISVMPCRGFNSTHFRNKYKERVEQNGDKHPVILYFGDFDPSGICMDESTIRKFQSELGVGFTFRRIALEKEDIFRYNLPHDPDAIKKKDKRTKKHVAEYGELAVELDALPVDVLEQKVVSAIESVIDMERLMKQIKIQDKEFIILNDLRKRVQDLM